jgi:hypothetical protein
MNARSVFLIALVVALLLPLAVLGQGKKDQEKKAAGEVSITGCLNKGAAPDQYVIKDDKTGKESVVTGDAKLLAAHANNHQVTITGTMAKEDNKEVLKATDVKMIAVCK